MNMKKSPLAIAVGTGLLTGLAATGANAKSSVMTDNNPFTMTELADGYMQLAKQDGDKKGMKDGACGEGMCGAKMMKEGALEKTSEGKCAGNKPMANEKKGDKKDMEGKCGEGKCGSNMK